MVKVKSNSVSSINTSAKFMLFDWTPKQTQLFIVSSLFFIGLVYYLLHTRYILYNGDEIWSMSRIYNYMMTGFNKDTIYRIIETEDKVLIFHLFFNSLYGHFFEFFGWTKSNAHLLNTFFIGLTAIQWYYILRKLEFSYNLSLLFGLSMLLFPAYFGAANLARVDAFVFFWATSAFHLFIGQYYFLAGFVMMIGVETHPMGAISGFYVLAFVLTRWTYFFRDRKRLVKIGISYLVGIGLGMLYYWCLHHQVLEGGRFSNTLLNYRNIKKEFPNYILTNFINPEWYLHIWELLVLILPIIIYLKKGLYKKKSFVWIFLLSLLFSTFITGRPNRYYFLYVFPAFQLLLFYTAEQQQLLKRLMYTLSVLFLLQYGTIYYLNRSYDIAKITTNIATSIPNKNIPVVGMSDNWLAAKDHPFYLIYNSIHDLPTQNLKELYLIQTDYLHAAPISLQVENFVLEQGWTKDPLMSKRKKHYLRMIDYFKSNYDYQLITKFEAYQGENIVLYYCQLKSE